MTPIEFREWMRGYLRVFPDTKAWLNALGSDDRPAVEEAWAEVLQDVELRDANAVTMRILSGDDPQVLGGDREMIPAHVRQLAKRNNERRLDRSCARSQSDCASEAMQDRRSGPTAKELFMSMLKVMESQPGLSAVEAAELVLPPSHENLNGRRYYCHLCLDSGIVMVWDQLSVDAAITGELDQPGKRRTCGAPCHCKAGDHYVWRNSGDPPRGWTGWLNADAVYAEDRYCICPGNDTDSPIAIESFKDWVADRQLAAVNEKREPAFQDWNAGGKENAVSN